MTKTFFSLAATAVCLAVATTIHAQSEPKPMSNSEPLNTSSNASSALFVGTYTGKGSEGIYRFRLDHVTGAMQPEGLAAKISNPSFLALSADKKYLYCCNEISDFNGKKSGAATSFEITSATGDLRQLDQAPSGGVGPCYVATTPQNDAVLVANYGSGSASIIATMDNGALEEKPAAVAQHSGSSVHPKRQKEPHTHSIRPDTTGQWAVAVDLGIDQVIAYKLSKGTMDTSSPVVNKTHPGAGPRHLAFHPNGKYAYVSNELDSSITAFAWDASAGTLTPIETTTTLPADYSGPENFPAEVLVHPSGKYVYLSNRGLNSVAAWSVDEATGKLTQIANEPTRGDHPRGMTLSPEGDFLLVANQNTDNIISYKINPADGKPVFASEYKGIGRPATLQFYVP